MFFISVDTIKMVIEKYVLLKNHIFLHLQLRHDKTSPVAHFNTLRL